MKFEYHHTFDVGVDQLLDEMFNPDLPPHLAETMTTIVSVEVLEREESDRAIRRRVKYVPVPMIKRIGPKKITPESMQWVEESEFDRAQRVVTFQNIPSHPKIRARMTNSGRIEFRPLGDNKCERVMTGELKIRFPILGRLAEKIIAKNGAKILDEEARVMSDWLKEKGA